MLMITYIQHHKYSLNQAGFWVNQADVEIAARLAGDP